MMDFNFREYMHNLIDDPDSFTILHQFWANVEITDYCWNWIAEVDEGGYGVFRLGGGNRLSAHRASYILWKGLIEDNLWVLHECDNRRCVNPAHLKLGARSDNMRDAWRKGRTWFQTQPELISKGASHHKAKLNSEQVEEIRAKYAEGGITMRALARLFDVSPATVQKIISGKGWKDNT